MPTDFTLNRRNFLAGAAAFAFGFQDRTLQGLEKLKPEEGAPDNEDFWLKVRGEFQHDASLKVFNNVGVSPSPLRTLEMQARLAKDANLDPSYIMWRKQDKELETVRESLAQILGCKATELALTANATFGLQAAISGLKMKRGDEILTTSHDYPRAITAMRQRERRDGVKVIEIELPARPIRPEEWAALVEAKLTDRTRLVCLCRMNYLNGQMVPVDEIKKLFVGRDLLFLVDGAQSIGLLPDAFRDLCDHLYTASLHKWMMGPVGTGVFVVREDLINRVWPLHPADPDLDDSITKFEQIGTHPAAPMLAMKEAIAFHHWLGRERKAARIQYLGQLVAKGLAGAQGVRIYSEFGEKMGHGMYTVGFEKLPSVELAGWLLQKHGIHVTTSVRAGFNGIRISPSIFSMVSEVKQLTSLLTEASRTGI